MFTRREAARVLGCSKERVRQFEKCGRLHVIVDARGVGHFVRGEVLALARTRNRPNADRVHGTIAAQVFDLFRQGVELPEIVIQTQQSPATIRALWEEYSRPLGAPPTPALDLARYDASDKAIDSAIEALRRRTPAIVSEPAPAPTNGAAHAVGPRSK